MLWVMTNLPTARQARRRRLLALVALGVVVAGVLALVLGGGSGGPKRLVPGGCEQSGTYDPLTWDSGRESDLVRRTILWSIGLLAGLCVLVYLQSTPVLSWMLP